MSEAEVKTWESSVSTDHSFFTIRVVRHWHRLPGMVVHALSLKTLKVRLDGVLSS